ncbi:uncharacterized protein SCHCODRAFT_02483637 [Schizophyllum commune H4-8]|uniref:DUF4211 domain-containing protein n=1 Tax=Schizophyllum commune (strain H4-8 / FGSC 9210) TaxID=578458 RepID=D8PT17_SCHCM|nr:uncharacterized protein SCHCODRAFT_02483637 [Schizophyllum commune H4-8]KAI5899468.1 hypothetical protein SCHCODRAFT_02483637 [Schizophyllum commune H4-8]
MAPKKKTTKNMRQTTLTGIVSSSPPRADSKAKKVKGSSRPTPTASQPKRARTAQALGSDTDSDPDAIQFEPRRKAAEVSISDSSEEEVLEPITPRKRRRAPAALSDSDASPAPKKKNKTKKGRTSAPKAASSKKKPIPISSSEDEAPKPPPPRKAKGKGKGKAKQPAEVLSGDEDEPPVRKSRFVKGERPPTKDTDSDSLLDEVEEERIIDSRFRERGKKSAFQKNLERLKRRKQGKPELSSSEEEEEEEGEESPKPRTFRGSKPSGDSLFGCDDESEASESGASFIVEDDGAAPVQLPAAFSLDTFQDLAHQFKKIFQFFCHIAVQPPDERHDFMEHALKNEEYFAVPLKMFRRKLIGLRDSLVAGSLWRADFKKALEIFPEFELVQMEYAVPDCDACHISTRMSTRIGRLVGYPYDPLGFQRDYSSVAIKSEDGSSDSDDDDPDDPDSPSALAKLKREFHLGKFCARRTRVFHELMHWEWALFETVRLEVDDLRLAKRDKKGYVKVAFEGGKKPPKDPTDADAICEWLDQRQIIQMEWRKVKDLMEAARGVEPSAGSSSTTNPDSDTSQLFTNSVTNPTCHLPLSAKVFGRRLDLPDSRIGHGFPCGTRRTMSGELFVHEPFEVSLCDCCEHSLCADFEVLTPGPKNNILRSGRVLSVAEAQVVKEAMAVTKNNIQDLWHEIGILWNRLEYMKEEADRWEEIRQCQAAYLAPIRRLPVEVLSEIFKICCGDGSAIDITKRSCPPLVLSSVCKIWRDVMHETPGIWADFTIPESSSLTSLNLPPHLLNRLDLFLANSGNLPLRHHTVQYFAPSNTLPMDGALQRLLPHSHRWTDMIIPNEDDNCPDVMKWLKGRSLMCLSKITSWTWNLGRGDPGYILAELPALRSVVLIDIDEGFESPRLPWGQIEELTAEMTTDKALSLVHNCPALKVWDMLSRDSQLPLEPLDVPVVLPHLHTFRVSIVCDDDIAVLERVTAPALQELQIYWRVFNPRPSGQICALLDRSSCSLRRLYLDGLEDTRDGWLESDALRELATLDLRMARLQPATQELFALLAQRDSAGLPRLLPRLESLSVQGLIQCTGETLLDMVEMRRDAGRPLHRFSLGEMSIGYGLDEWVEERLAESVPHFDIKRDWF